MSCTSNSNKQAHTPHSYCLLNQHSFLELVQVGQFSKDSLLFSLVACGVL